MNNPYDLHSWSKLYREEALQQARTRQLLERARTSPQPSGLRRVGLAWNNALALARGWRSA
jgi:hypothetical protein